MLDRMRRMVERDKNHPSVVIWSLGNESGTRREPRRRWRDWTRERDPSRPLHYERDPSYRVRRLLQPMYTAARRARAIGRGEEPPLDDPALDARRRPLPFLLCEYAHAMGNGPGGLPDYQRAVRALPALQGGFVWEWIDHGLRADRDGGVLRVRRGLRRASSRRQLRLPTACCSPTGRRRPGCSSSRR